jgi:hypothetical protein
MKASGNTQQDLAARVSALMDDAAGAESELALRELAGDARARRAWLEYHQIGDLLRSAETSPLPDEAAFIRRFAARLEQEAPHRGSAPCLPPRGAAAAAAAALATLALLRLESAPPPRLALHQPRGCYLARASFDPGAAAPAPGTAAAPQPSWDRYVAAEDGGCVLPYTAPDLRAPPLLAAAR